MPIPISGLISDFKGITDKLSSLAKSKIDYITDPTNNPLPDAIAIADGLIADNLATHSLITSLSSGALDIGVVKESLHRIDSIKRGVSLRTLSKYDIYSQYLSENTNAISNHLADEALSVNAIRGTSTFQRT